ncbi:MAG: histidine phosphatase family protein [Ilumatobacteraceae bacterium]
MTTLLLVRHGESIWNAARRWQGRADPPLSERGEEQARAAARALAAHGPFDAVVTSNLQRARQTGELLAAGASIELGDAVTDLQERSAGEWQGLTRVEIEERYPGFLASGERPPGYEPDQAVIDRALAALATIAGAGDRRLVVVSHGGVIHALERHVLGTDHDWLRLDNLDARRFEFADGVLRMQGDRISLAASGVTATPAEPGYA